MKAINLKTQWLKNPIGIDISCPTLSWNCTGGLSQTGYRVIARDDTGNPLWDSGKVETGSMRCDWGSAAVLPRTSVNWNVTLWDENGASGAPETALFETGIDEWQASWITGNYRVNRKQRYPVDCFRKCFEAGEVRKARLYITACGLYEAKLNGHRVGNFILAPGITDYRKRVQYQSYDVTELLQSGENALTVQLADGWYRGSTGAWGLRNQYGTETKLLAQLMITHPDGSVQVIATDESWDWSNDGAIRFADNKDGEVVNASNTPSYQGKAKATSHSVIPTASNNVPVTEHERLKPACITTPSGNTVLDFGQNIAGYAEFAINAHAGQKIKLRFGELLDAAGEFTQKNIQCSGKHKTTPLQQVIYTCKEGENYYKTTFSLFGFQYVLVETDAAVQPEDFTAIAVYSDLERTGWFESSNALLDKFVENTVWSAKNNHADLPTDCPTRERHGWSGDAQIFCSTACYLFDYEPFAAKYLNDLYDWQKRSGCLPQIAPEGGTDFYMRSMNGSVGWADAGIIMPYVLWKQYGDRKILEKYIAGMEKYAAFQMRRCGKWYPTAKRTGLRGSCRKYLNNAGQAYGEWAEPDEVHHMTWKDCAVPHPEVATAYTAHILTLLSEMETELRNTKKAEKYINFAESCKSSYRALVKTKAYSLDTDRQARLVRPLAFDLLDEAQTAYAKERLIQALDHYSWRVGTGFLSTPLILEVLNKINPEYAYRLLENEKMPGWLFMPKNGATTVWEAWEGTETKNGGIASLNHYSKGAACRFLFDTICGIQISGENEFTVAPVPGGTLTEARAVYRSVYGEIESAWKKKNGKIIYTVTIPAGCRAKVLLPGGKTIYQTAGKTAYEEYYERY